MFFQHALLSTSKCETFDILGFFKDLTYCAGLRHTEDDMKNSRA